ncbi:MAG: 5-formyltetrahydrofolate cyclo-ligase [Lachnospiraceae bacterium]|nr:5-formyltetrahydrofolate cyclo-ligase [Lachnospiraceae bacterium]
MSSDSDIRELKKSLRNRIIEKRNLIDEVEREKKSRKIYEKLCKNKVFCNAETIFFFAGYGSEVKTLFMIEDMLKSGKSIALPRVISKTEMRFLKIDSLENLIDGYKGIPEPEESCFEIKEADLILMPGVAFDTDRNRIGYGRGYYDRFISESARTARTIAICYDEQIVEKVPVNENDLRPELIITDLREIR